jgi:hypothetical protein
MKIALRVQAGRERQVAAAERTAEVDFVRELEEFKPPNTTALRFY